MSKTAEKADPKLWEKVKEEVEAGDKGGKPGQWSARKAQLAVHEYKEEGGGYKGEKPPTTTFPNGPRRSGAPSPAPKAKTPASATCPRRRARR